MDFRQVSSISRNKLCSSDLWTAFCVLLLKERDGKGCAWKFSIFSLASVDLALVSDLDCMQEMREMHIMTFRD